MPATTITTNNTNNKIDYTTIVDGKEEENHWIRKSVLFIILLVCLGLYCTTNNNNTRFVHNEPVAASSSLVRSGAGDGDGGGNGNGEQEGLSFPSVGDNYIKSITNSFVEEEEEGGLPTYCYTGPCSKYNGDGQACVDHDCVWFRYQILHGEIGVCSDCRGVSCDGSNPHSATECDYCPCYNGIETGKNCCHGECEWRVGIPKYLWVYPYDGGGCVLK